MLLVGNPAALVLVDLVGLDVSDIELVSDVARAAAAADLVTIGIVAEEGRSFIWTAWC